MKKKIGISYTETNFQNYDQWFTAQDLGDDLEIIILSFIKNNTEDISKCEGFVLTGGIDVQPSLYGGDMEYAYRPTAFLPERDQFEKLIYEYAKSHRLPVLGICRGLQYINILEGGKVFEDIGELSNGIHKRATVDKEHRITIVPDTLLHSITEVDRGIVNSAHHQAIRPDMLGNNIMISAYSDTDGIIEGIEYKDKTNKAFMLAVQWHPERMKRKEESPFSRNIKSAFINAVRTHKYADL
ncbi:putative glutamine amidotransferase [Chitinophaga terrae (ex Kim and Jung 2007)]|uniref:gamma-glutamyl-gamma-aminobutyrate hydrolase family protein n=1 Tax=Chitinophaga terrae (ex Kim and Jung 2007) TaxID=408074 RepID=UPI00278A759F|nr:gamma-glutamyl-gamma-aminobutyrate hydrolase family protein [Chitinophaga terrae (ex Kim and Jung 2007)]MDQ0109523.1 putative glutamine amidotransferase [Chitinophaga terrae (ex Kim and Jung 2007)]